MKSASDDVHVHGGRADRDWTQGSIGRNLWSLSWPMVITNSFMMLGPTIDMIWVGKLGSASVAGVVVPAIILTIYFKTGRWKRKKI